MEAPLPDLTVLPVRVKGKYADSIPKQKVVTNHFELKLDMNLDVYIYCVKFEPQVHAGNRLLLRKFPEFMAPHLEPKIGKFVMNGMNLFAIKKMDGKITFDLTNPELEKKYSVTVIKVKTISMKDIESSNAKTRNGPIMFLNNLFKSYLRQLKFTEIGRTKKYFNTQTSNTVAFFKIFDGFECSIAKLAGGVFLKIDTCCKLVTTQSCLEVINNIYKQNNSKNKEDKRALVYQHFHNKMVMSNYG